MSGKFIVVFGPTGVGKGTLVSYIKETFPQLVAPKTTATRAMRPGESEGNPYNFVSVDEFKKRIDGGVFIEWAIYSDNYYGTPLAPIEKIIQEGDYAIKELEVQGVRQLLEKVARENLFIIYVDGGSWESLEKRIRARAPISETDVAGRKERYEDESASKDLADVIIKNEDGELEAAKAAFKKAIDTIL